MFNFFFRPYVPGFHVRPDDDIPGFNIDKNSMPRRGAWSDGMPPDAAVLRYVDTAQVETPRSIGFLTPSPEAVQTPSPIGLSGYRPSSQADVPGFNVMPWDDVPGFNLNEDGMLSQFPVAEEPIQSAPPQLPEWLYKVATILPQLTALDPLTGRHIAIGALPGLPSTELPVAEQLPSWTVPHQFSDSRSRAATTLNTNVQSPAQSATAKVWPQLRNARPHVQLARLHDLESEITRQPIGVSPIQTVALTEGNVPDAGGPQAQRQTPLQQYQPTQPSSSLGTAAPSSSGPSLGQRLVQSSVETIVPGAHYQNLARQQLGSGNYIGAGVYQAAAFLDAALGAATLGLSTRLGAASRAAAGQGAALFRRAFDSKSRLFGYLGRAPKGMEWHHIVEQSQAAKFGQRAIQSVDNIVAIPIEAHRRLNGFYSSKQSFSEPKTVREWLRDESFEAQYEFGLRQLKRVLGY